MAGDKADIQQTPAIREAGVGQLDMWTLLGTTAETLASELRSSEGQKEKLRRARAALDAAKLPAGRVAGWGSQARIRPAKHGNAFVVTRRRD